MTTRHLHSLRAILRLCAISTWFRISLAATPAAASANFLVYWGQDSSGLTGGPSQKRLLDYCADENFDIVAIAFLEQISIPSLNLNGVTDFCTTDNDQLVTQSGTILPNCTDIASDITACQETYDKTILLSIGGATYTEGGFPSVSAATMAAQNLWAIFGPPTTNLTVTRPFGTAVINGFDLDIESETQNMVPFANELRSLMDTYSVTNLDISTTNTAFYLTAAPQCPYPDLWNEEMLNGNVSFDYISVQFYNNECGVQSFVSGAAITTFNFDQWDTWATSVSKNRDVKVLLGVAGGIEAATSGYVDLTVLGEIIEYCKQFQSFGGVMAWDASQVDANTGFAAGVKAALTSVSSRAMYAAKKRRY